MYCHHEKVQNMMYFLMQMILTELSKKELLVLLLESVSCLNFFSVR